MRIEEHERTNKGKTINMITLMDVIESVLRDVLSEYDVFGEKECDCKPDMKKVEKIALQERMSTDEILRLCSQISQSAKGTYGK